jgi:hypothetical protein
MSPSLTRRLSRALAAVLAAACAVFAACKKAEPPPPPLAAAAPAPTPVPAGVRVVSVTLGNAVDADKKVAAPVESFGVKDTIYASVATEGAATSAKLTAKWTFGAAGQSVKDEDQSIAPTGPAVTEFHISKADGWPKGDYKVEILLDGASAATKTFKVQ